MSFFNSIFGKREASTTNINWTFLEDVNQLDSIIEASKTKPQAIFKHSTRCGISSMVIKQFENSFDLPDDSIDLYYLDLLNYRDISNAVAQKFDIPHQSPQLIVLKNKKVIAHDSHHGILSVKLN